MFARHDTRVACRVLFQPARQVYPVVHPKPLERNVMQIVKLTDATTKRVRDVILTVL
jgi:hypothetical protein